MSWSTGVAGGEENQEEQQNAKMGRISNLVEGEVAAGWAGVATGGGATKWAGAGSAIVEGGVAAGWAGVAARVEEWSAVVEGGVAAGWARVAAVGQRDDQ